MDGVSSIGHCDECGVATYVYPVGGRLLCDKCRECDANQPPRGEKQKLAIAQFTEEQWEQVKEMRRDSEALRRWKDNPMGHYGELARRGIDASRGVDYAEHWRRIGEMGRSGRERA